MRTRTDHSHLRSRKSLSVFVTRCGPRETPADEHAHHTNESPRNRTFSVAKTIFLFGRRDVGTEKLLLETQHHFRRLFLALCPEWKMGLDASLRAPFFLRSIETQSPFVPPACLSASNRRRLLAAAPSSLPPSLPPSLARSGHSLSFTLRTRTTRTHAAGDVLPPKYVGCCGRRDSRLLKLPSFSASRSLFL